MKTNTEPPQTSPWKSFPPSMTASLIASIVSFLVIFIIGALIFYFRHKISESKNKAIENKAITKDLIGRNQLSKYYLNTIQELNKNGYSRFAIKGNYGYGKSYIADQLMELSNNDETLIPIKFAAWEQDEYYSPIERLLINIHNNSGEIGMPNYQKKNLKKLIQKDSKLIDLSFNQYIKRYDHFKANMMSIKPPNSKKIVIIIDELDRCARNDALEFLEITNQMFIDKKDIILIYLYDLEAVQNIIKHNTGIDDTKYINKFIDFTFSLPNGAFDYFQEKLKEKQYKKIQKLGNNINQSIFQSSLRQVNLFLTWYNFIEKKLTNNHLLDLIIVERMLTDLTKLKRTDAKWNEIINNYFVDKNAELGNALNLVRLKFTDIIRLDGRDWGEKEFEYINTFVMGLDATNYHLDFKIPIVLNSNPNIFLSSIPFGQLEQIIITLLKTDMHHFKELQVNEAIINNFKRKISTLNSIDVTHNSWPNTVEEDIEKLKEGFFQNQRIPEWAKNTKSFIEKLHTSVIPEYMGW